MLLFSLEESLKLDILHHLLLDLTVEVRALVFVDPLGNLLGFDLASFNQRLRVRFVGKPQIEMVSCVLNVEGNGLRTDFKRHTARLPWIKLTVREDNI
jgi:hypothetical protein